MTEKRPYRAGLGIPEAKIIRSSPVSPTPAPPLVYDPNVTPLDYSEWRVNPSKHGPERLRRPPIFIPSEATYDELGRSMIDGVGVAVDIGKERVVKGDRAQGEDVAGWYSALAARSTKSTSTAVESRNAEAGPSRAPSPPKSSVDQSFSIDHSPGGSHTSPARPLRVKRQEWFIRRALLTASQQAPADTTPPAPRPPTISSMLQIDTAAKPAKPVQYFLGPDNVGHAMLRNRLGWEGGGLGRPEGWDEDKWQAHLARMAQQHSVPPPAGFSEDVVDMTGDTNDTDDQDRPNIASTAPFASGPGRIAPIATTLKLDRLGIGHRRAKDKATDQTAKRVTHSQADLREAQRKAKYMRPVGKPDLGKRGKVRWRDKDKRERDERQRLKMALNA